MADFLIVGAVAIILFLAVCYIRKQKKKGVPCIGCPDAGSCSGQCGSCQGCQCKK